MADVSKVAANGIEYNVKDAAARSDITTLQSGLSTANGNITTLQNGLSTANGNITTLQTQVAGMIAGGSGYCKFSDGTLIQYGKASSFSLSGSVVYGTVTMGQAFIDTNYVVILTPARNSLAYLTLPFCEGNDGGNIVRTTTTFAIAAKGTNTNVDANWIAIGRWK